LTAIYAAQLGFKNLLTQNAIVFSMLGVNKTTDSV